MHEYTISRTYTRTHARTHACMHARTHARALSHTHTIARARAPRNRAARDGKLPQVVYLEPDDEVVTGATGATKSPTKTKEPYCRALQRSPIKKPYQRALLKNPTTELYEREKSPANPRCCSNGCRGPRDRPRRSTRARALRSHRHHTRVHHGLCSSRLGLQAM